MILVAGALLLTPGFITDAAGFACLVPSLRRRLILAGVSLRPAGPAGAARPRGGPQPGRRTLEGEYWRPEDRDRHDDRRGDGHG